MVFAALQGTEEQNKHPDEVGVLVTPSEAVNFRPDLL